MTQCDIGNGTTLQQTIRVQGGGFHNQPAASSDDPGPRKAKVADPAIEEHLEMRTEIQATLDAQTKTHTHTHTICLKHTRKYREKPRDATTTMFLHVREKRQTTHGQRTGTGATRADEARGKRKRRGRKAQACVSAAFVAHGARLQWSTCVCSFLRGCACPGSCRFLCARMFLARHTTLCFQWCPLLMASKAYVFHLAFRLMPWSLPLLFLDRMLPAEGWQCQWRRSVSSGSRSSQNTDGTDASMSELASWFEASDTCFSLAAPTLQCRISMVGQVRREPSPLSQLQLASPVLAVLVNRNSAGAVLQLAVVAPRIPVSRVTHGVCGHTVTKR